jgi:hypothetical protein
MFDDMDNSAGRFASGTIFASDGVPRSVSRRLAFGRIALAESVRHPRFGDGNANRAAPPLTQIQ